ncbi:hypothetical protein Tco_0435707 [Tanacetum coccineum]
MDSEVPNFEAKKRDTKRYKSSGSSSFNPDYGNASINLNVDDGDEEEDEVQEVERLIGMDKAKGFKKKGAGASGSSATMNDEALARLMVFELAMHHKHSMAMKREERLAFLKIKKREVEIRERKLAIQEYKQCQKNIMFYMQPYNHLTEDALKQMEDIRTGIKAKWNLPY